MNLEDILNLDDESLKKSLLDERERLFNLYQKLDITLLRVGIMSLTIHDNHCTLNEVLDHDDLLLKIQHYRYFYNLADCEVSARSKRV